ncbi:YbaB/EbfC family nucleoid-associated protein [Amycolatopsis sp. 195334CR]|uniref:YbaB/EbfC family nucleoid-associated protein n=1 Tax=Amycolatopsis sp. 195334CR TaxID=2814588 RepID=UPI001A8D5A10|nr:YbaB/EbfC family nucleoid-associated protein [Amycolatopsis sp. 195334CR]MBN6040394.1 YbaB/EbfC family nucleoid-associated protein [Amycolatopsis sp. 195334CR]
MARPTIDLAARRRDYARLHDISRRIADIEATADSSDGLVSATVVGRGELSELHLDPRLYRTMDSTALAASIVDTIKDAVEQSRRQLFEITRDYLPPGAKFETTDVHTDAFMHQLDQEIEGAK